MDNRPFTKIKKQNLSLEYRKHFLKQVAILKENTDILAISLNGGVSRGYADHLSEIDLTIYLEEDKYIKWSNSTTPISKGITYIDGLLYDIKVENFSEFELKKFDETELWDMSYAEILYDPKEKLQKIFTKYIGSSTDYSRIERTLFNCWWHYKLAGDIWIYREDYIQGHMMFNKAVEEIVKCIFILNREYIPHEKWLIHMSRTLNWLPKDWDKKLEKAMSTGNIDKQSLIYRQAIIDELWNNINKVAKEKYCIDLPVFVMQKYFYDILIKLTSQNEFTFDEWKKIAEIDLLNSEPFHSFTKIIDDKIYADYNKILTLEEKDIYSWHYEVLDAFRKTLN